MAASAFGRIVHGMDVVRRIQMSPPDGETLTPPITIVRMRRTQNAGKERL